MTSLRSRLDRWWNLASSSCRSSCRNIHSYHLVFLALICASSSAIFYSSVGDSSLSTGSISTMKPLALTLLCIWSRTVLSSSPWR